MNRSPEPVATYARFSTDKQDSRSIDDQLRRCQEVAVRSGYEVVVQEADSAVSGSHVDRAGLQRLLLAAQRSPSPFRAVLVDDLSRLSRDLGDTWRIVFDELASANVRVIDCSTGMASNAPGARLTFGALALVNDTFLQMVKHETHRGLQGRALAGFWTGGKVYGYSTVTEENPPDLEHPRKVPVIDAREAAIILRVCEMFLGGAGYKSIADTLNREGVAAPHDGGKGNKNGRGWGHTSIRNMLRNERYVGRWTWNATRTVGVPGKKARRRVARPVAEHVVREVPELVIIDDATWCAVQEKLAIGKRQRPRGGRPPGSGKYPYLTSGLLRCGECGGSMSIIGARQKKGVRYATFGCLANRSRGESICGNNLTISERKITAALLGALRDVFADPQVVERVTERFARRVARGLKDQPTGDLVSQIRDAERRLANVTDALANLGKSDALLAKLRAEESRLAALKSDLAAAVRRDAPRSVPDPSAVRAYLTNLAEVLGKNPGRGRDLLAAHLSPITLTPNGKGPGRHYVGDGAFNLSRVLEKGSSGGALDQLIYRISKRISPSWA